MKIESVPLSSLRAYAGNARTHSPEQIARIAISLREFGWMLPVLIDAKRTIIAGHARVEAARSLLEDDTAKIPGWPQKRDVPTIQHRKLTPAQVRAYTLADNRLADLSIWNLETLLSEVEALKALDFNPELIALDAADMDELFGKPKGGGASGKTVVEIEEQFAILVTCRDEKHQRTLLTRFDREGLKCRALLS